MNLKEAFRYKHLLNEWANNAASAAATAANMYDVVEHHLKSTVIPTEKDEDVVVQSARKYNANAGELVNFSRAVLEEYTNLSAEIDRTMAVHFNDYKSTLDAVRLIRSMVERFNTLLNARRSESRSKEEATCVTANGDTVQYTYPVIMETMPTFNVEALESEIRRLLDVADNASSEIEKALVTVELENFTPRFSVNDTVQSAIRQVLNK